MQASIATFPPELFAKFCIFLPPADLFTLSQVCRKFRGFLCAPDSSTTQQIWKESRLQFMPKENMPPPEGMSEEKYVELLMKGRGCQVCNRKKNCKIYWEFGVRCCEECFLMKTVARSELTEYPLDFINVMPYFDYYSEKHYWVEQIVFAYSQYYDLSNLSKENLQSWLDSKKRIFNSIMKYAEQRKPIPFLRVIPNFTSPPLDFFVIRNDYVNRVQVANNDVRNLPQQIQVKPKKNKGEFYNKHTKHNTKGKQFKNKFTRIYG